MKGGFENKIKIYFSFHFISQESTKSEFSLVHEEITHILLNFSCLLGFMHYPLVSSMVFRPKQLWIGLELSHHVLGIETFSEKGYLYSF